MFYLSVYFLCWYCVFLAFASYGCSLTNSESSYIAHYVVFQTLKATNAKARVNPSLACLICAAMLAVVGSSFD